MIGAWAVPFVTIALTPVTVLTTSISAHDATRTADAARAAGDQAGPAALLTAASRVPPANGLGR